MKHLFQHGSTLLFQFNRFSKCRHRVILPTSCTKRYHRTMHNHEITFYSFLFYCALFTLSLVHTMIGWQLLPLRWAASSASWHCVVAYSRSNIIILLVPTNIWQLKDLYYTTTLTEPESGLF